MQINNRLMAGLQAGYGSKTFNRVISVKGIFYKWRIIWKNTIKRKETDHEALSPHSR